MKFQDRYDLEDARQWVEEEFSSRSEESWRSVVEDNIDDQGRELTREIEAEVRSILAIEDDDSEAEEE